MSSDSQQSNSKLLDIHRNISSSVSAVSVISDCDDFDYLFPDMTDELGSSSDSMDSPQSTPTPHSQSIEYETKTPDATPNPPKKSTTATTAETHDNANAGTDNPNVEDDSNILIALDWDDTLHPTSAFRTKLDINSVRRFCLNVYETLLTLIRLYGASNIYIVSNADKLWIQQCLGQLSAGYFVNIYHLISLYNIRIISAKNEFSKIHPNDSLKWKQLTFEHLVNKHYTKSKKSGKQFIVVSIGDSPNEYIASKRVIQRLNSNKLNEKKIVLHRIKLLQNPSVNELIEQYQLIKKIAVLFGTQVDHGINIDYLREMKKYYQRIAH